MAVSTRAGGVKIGSDFVVVTVDDAQAFAMLSAIAGATDIPAVTAWNSSAMVPWWQKKVVLAFTREGSKEFGPWAQLKPATQNIRASMGYPPDHPILVRKGAFKNWLRTDRGDAKFMTRSTALSAMSSGARVFGGKGSWAGATDYIIKFPWPGDAPTPELRRKLQGAQRGTSRNKAHFGPTPARPVVTMSGNDVLHAIATLSVWVAALSSRFMGMNAVMSGGNGP